MNFRDALWWTRKTNLNGKKIGVKFFSLFFPHKNCHRTSTLISLLQHILKVLLFFKLTEICSDSFQRLSVTEAVKIPTIQILTFLFHLNKNPQTSSFPVFFFPPSQTLLHCSFATSLIYLLPSPPWSSHSNTYFLSLCLIFTSLLLPFPSFSLYSQCFFPYFSCCLLCSLPSIASFSFYIQSRLSLSPFLCLNSLLYPSVHCSTTVIPRLISPPSVRLLDPLCLPTSCPVIASVGGLTSLGVRH